MEKTKVVAKCNLKNDACTFDRAPEFVEEVYVCNIPHCKMRLRDGRTLAVLGKTLGEFPVTEISLCGMPECRFTLKKG